MENKSKNKQKIIRRKIAYIITVIILLILGFILLLGNGKTSSHVEPNMKRVFVSDGDTLWEIAETEAVNNMYYHEKDVRYIIKDIKNLNNLKNSNLFIGQELIIPSL